MSPSKLISISKKFNTTLKGQSLSTIYNTIMTSKHYEPIKQLLSGEEILILVFLIKLIGNTENPESLYNTIKSNFFTFFLVEIVDVDPEDTCPSCSGEGRERCYNCNANGEVDCYECGGDGEDYDGGACQACGGDGEMTCDDCGGDGEVTCNECDGGGYVTKFGYNTISNNYYVSCDPSIFNRLELMDEQDKIDSSLENKIHSSRYTFLFNSVQDESEKIPTRFDRDDLMFVSLEKTDNEFYVGDRFIRANNFWVYD